MVIYCLVGSVVQRSSDDEVLQVPDKNRRLGVDAVIRNDRTQFEKFAPALHRLRQLRIDKHGEHGFNLQLRAEIVLSRFESRKSTERACLDSYDRSE